MIYYFKAVSKNPAKSNISCKNITKWGTKGLCDFSAVDMYIFHNVKGTWIFPQCVGFAQIYELKKNG